MADENDDITLDSETGIDDSVLTDEHQGDTIKKLKEKLKEAEEKAKEYLDKWQRAQADFVNLRKRDEEAKVEFLKFANVGLISELLPVLDGLSLAVSHGDKGVEAIHNLLLKTLKQNGLEEINPLGEIFDPNFHEAIGIIKTEKADENHKILEVSQKGYIMESKVLRPAKVRVGEFEGK